ncbi:MAG TPA: N-(5'-phosphoribosyl)anthranilate isomerase, partial [Rhizobiaceae bacterium]|nr:N-(5'-phosphoribosyl)anthranilate isomerase [Rhizobiaceae bacterium]
MHIKLCGLKTPEAIDAAIAEGATHLGFIFFEKSPRNVTRELAATLAANARAKAGAPKLVAVTVDAEDGFLDAIVKAVRPDMLQLHGRETPQRLEELKARHGL